MGDPRNRPAIWGSVAAGIVLFLLTWQGLDWPVALGWLVAWSLPTFVIYGVDKAQSRRAGWRVPETLLHVLALAGGVLGAWAGRLAFHHKTTRPIFLVVLVAASLLWGAILAWALVTPSS